MSLVVPQALPPVPQVALRLYGNQALKTLNSWVVDRLSSQKMILPFRKHTKDKIC